MQVDNYTINSYHLGIDTFSLNSLVVKNSLEDKGPSQDNEPIDETEMFSTYGTFRKMSRSRRWSEKGTAEVYKNPIFFHAKILVLIRQFTCYYKPASEFYSFKSPDHHINIVLSL